MSRTHTLHTGTADVRLQMVAGLLDRLTRGLVNPLPRWNRVNGAGLGQSMQSTVQDKIRHSLFLELST